MVEQVGNDNEKMDDRCDVCPVEDAAEELSDGGKDEEDDDEETETIKRSARRDGVEGLQTFRAAKDERVLKNFAGPSRSTQREIEDHERTHLPYRNWCPICVQAKGRGH